jgi:alpha-mannosidase
METVCRQCLLEQIRGVNRSDMMRLDIKRLLVVGFCLAFGVGMSHAQTAYFVDGYHGGVYGHYPRWQTRFMVEQLQKHPDWRINLEIEPETWDSVKVYDPEAYAAFKDALQDVTIRERVEFVNPAYGQAYMFNITGESVIRQFSYGMKKMKEHFSSVDFRSYSSEEPCFTSALPQILKSFGFTYASLKNPNTCWGGYTRAHGAGIVNWVGPDGTGIATVPRYRCEQLLPGSTWQTTAWGNSQEYIEACLRNKIVSPVGMCLQDAGWRGGPWLGVAKSPYQPSLYTTWRNYFKIFGTAVLNDSWRVSQEDMLVSLVWGSQVLQRLAQQVRVAENKIVMAEKVATLRALEEGTAYPKKAFDSAWRTLLLAQHHDCWIVPYNGKPGHTWADMTRDWTAFTVQTSDSIVGTSALKGVRVGVQYIRVFNTTASDRYELISVPIASGIDVSSWGIQDEHGNWIDSQLIENEPRKLSFLARVPAVGYATYRVSVKKPSVAKGKHVSVGKDKAYVVDTHFYHLAIDPARGGVIKSLKAKTLQNKEFVDAKHERSFNELRGFFYEENAFLSSTDKPATVSVLEDGPLQTRLQIVGQIGAHPFRQVVTLYQHDPKIDFDLTIDWKGNPGIGKYSQARGYKAENPEKAFYDDRYKLLALFPTSLGKTKIYKDAPFDVTESALENTYFDRWDSIKNNVMLRWVDAEDAAGDYGMTLLTDHTTSYVSGADLSLGLTLQYSGTALWGMGYKIEGPSQIHYALVPHARKWDAAGVSETAARWNEPLIPVMLDEKPARWSKSWLTLSKGWEVTSLQLDGDDVLLRIFNASSKEASGSAVVPVIIREASQVELNGDVRSVLPVTVTGGKSTVTLSVPPFGICTIKMKLSK